MDQCCRVIVLPRADGGADDDGLILSPRAAVAGRG